MLDQQNFGTYTVSYLKCLSISVENILYQKISICFLKITLVLIRYYALILRVLVMKCYLAS